jgi:hypothetical protein
MGAATLFEISATPEGPSMIETSLLAIADIGKCCYQRHTLGQKVLFKDPT